MLFFCHLQFPTVLGICKGKRLRSERERLKNEQEHREIRLSSERGADLSGMWSVEGAMLGTASTEDGQWVRYGLAQERSGNKSSTLI